MARDRRQANRSGSTFRQAGFVVGLLGGSAVAVGLYEPGADFAVVAMILAGLVLIFALLEMRQGGDDSPSDASFFGTAGPLLWVVVVWILFRHFGQVAPQLILLPVGFIGWLVISFPSRAHCSSSFDIDRYGGFGCAVQIDIDGGNVSNIVIEAGSQ